MSKIKDAILETSERSRRDRDYPWDEFYTCEKTNMGFVYRFRDDGATVATFTSPDGITRTITMKGGN